MKIKINKTSIFLILIILITIFLRFYNLSSVPPSASLDETSIGYNAYSILKTGADEYGTKFPLLLRAYDDWRPAFYVYLVIPFVKFFGLNVISVRLPSVILSVLSVLATFFIVKDLILKFGKRIKGISSDYIALFASFLLTISPWHIYISRLGHEANLGLAFFIFALLFFLKQRIYLSLIFFSLSFASYQSEKIFIPFFLLSLFILFYKDIFMMKKKFFFASIISLTILVPFMKETFSPNALIRFRATSTFEANKERFYKETLLLDKSVKSNDLVGRIIHNRRVVSLEIISENYFSHFNPFWLFVNTSNDRHKVPDLGLMYIWEFPLILVGLVFLIFKKFDLKLKILIILWLLFSPLPSSVTTDSPHAMRAYNFLPSWQIISSLGAFYIFGFFKNFKIKAIFVLVFIIISFFSLLNFYKQYFQVFPKTQSSSFQYALSKTIPFVLEKQSSFSKVVFSNKENLYQSYMFFLFYTKYDPLIYQKEGGTKSGGFAENHKFGKYEFRPINWEKEDKDTLYIGNLNDFKTSKEVLRLLSNLDKEQVIEITKK